MDPKLPFLEMKFDSLGPLFILLPGFLSYVIVHALCSRKKKHDTAEIVLHALVYTLIVNAIWQLLLIPKPIIPTPHLVGLSITALAVAIVASACINHGLFYIVLQKLKITRESAWGSVWKTAFRQAYKDGSEYAMLWFSDKTGVLGAVRGYSSEQKDGHIRVDRAKWISKEGALIDAPGTLLFKAEDVTAIQFLRGVPEQGATPAAPSVQSHRGTNGSPDLEIR